MIRVLLADDHKIVIDGLQLMLAAEDDMECVAVAATGEEALAACQATNVDVAILDISMPGLNGIEVTRRLKAEQPKVRVIGLSMLSELSLIRSILDFGAAGFLPKIASQEEVVSTIRAVHAGAVVVAKDVQELLDNSKTRTRTTLTPRLSRREKDVLRLIINEHTTTEISEALFISKGTVEAHRRNMLSKLGVRNTAGLVRTCLENALLE